MGVHGVGLRASVEMQNGFFACGTLCVTQQRSFSGFDGYPVLFCCEIRLLLNLQLPYEKLIVTRLVAEQPSISAAVKNFCRITSRMASMFRSAFRFAMSAAGSDIESSL